MELQENNETILFILTTVMEIATLACAYLGLRLALIIVPLVANAILYLIFETTPFFYLGVILLLCIPFVWPRKSA